jgi:hypothetical protein
MAKFGIVRARPKLGFTPSTAVRSNIDTGDVGTGGAIGQALVGGIGLGQKIKERQDKRQELRAALELKNRKNIDVREKRKSELEAADLKRDVDFIVKTSAPDKHADEVGARFTQYESNLSKLDLSPEAREDLTIEAGGLRDRLEDEVFAAGVLRHKQTAIKTTQEKITSLFREGRPKREELREQVEILRFNGVSFEEIVIMTKAGEKAGMELRHEDAVEEIGNEAVSNPVATLSKSLEEQGLRKEGKGEIPTEELTDKDLVTAERVAKNRIDEIERNGKEAANTAQREEENRIFEGLDDGTATSADIVNNDILDVTAKRRLLDDESQFVKMDLQKSWPLTDNDTVVQDLNTKLTDQSSGLTDINEMNKFINDAATSGKLTKETRDKMRADAKKGGLDAIDEQVNASTLRVKNALIGRLSAREARFKVAELSRDLTRDEQRQARSVGFLSQVGFEQLNRFNAELNKRMRELGKETISGVEAESLAAQVWDKYKKKDDAQKIREFLQFTGQRVPRPDGFSQEKWDSIGLETKAQAVSGIAEGMTIEQVEAMIAK